eukprot:1327194-Amorphochlora_amoeboformis.AAC.1
MVDHHRPLLPLPPRNTGRARALLTSLLGMLAVLSGLVILASWGSSGVLTTALRGASSRAVSVDGRVRWGQRPYRVSPASLRSFARKGKKEEESKYAGTVEMTLDDPGSWREGGSDEGLFSGKFASYGVPAASECTET